MLQTKAPHLDILSSGSYFVTGYQSSWCCDGIECEWCNPDFSLETPELFHAPEAPPSWSNTSNMNAPSPSGWTCLWKLKERTVRGHNLPFTPGSGVAWSGLTLQYGIRRGRVLWKHALSLLDSENIADWCAHKRGLMAGGGGVRS